RGSHGRDETAGARGSRRRRAERARGRAGAVIVGAGAKRRETPEVHVVTSGAGEGVEGGIDGSPDVLAEEEIRHLPGPRLLPTVDVDPRGVELDLVRIARRPGDGSGEYADRGRLEVERAHRRPRVLRSTHGEDRILREQGRDLAIARDVRPDEQLLGGVVRVLRGSVRAAPADDRRVEV